MVSHTGFRSIRHRVFSGALIVPLLLVFGCDSSDTRTTAKRASTTEVQLRITSPTNGATVAYYVEGGVTLTSQTKFTAAISGGTEPVTITWLVEGSTTSTSATGNALVIVPDPLAEGLYKVTAVAKDAAGLTSSETINVTIAMITGAPEFQLRITSPTNGATVAYFVDAGKLTSQTTFTATIFGGTEPITITWLVEGATSSTSATGNALVIVPSPLEAGSHKVTAVARDAVGLTSSETITVTITLP